MIFTGLLGYCWAKAEPEMTSAAPSAAMLLHLFILWFLLDCLVCRLLFSFVESFRSDEPALIAIFAVACAAVKSERAPTWQGGLKPQPNHQ
jgi:hypothetical protein